MASVLPLDSPIGAIVREVDLGQRPDPSTVELVEDALERHGVLVFPSQRITPAQQVDFSKSFAQLELTKRVDARLDSHPEIFVVGNTGKHLVSFAPANPNDPLEWHADHMHLEAPARASLLYALAVPDEGADTMFSCMYSVFDSLTEAQKRQARGLQAKHSAIGLHRFLKNKGQSGATETNYLASSDDAVVWPLVRHHPRSGRESLYFGSQVSIGIEGWQDEDAIAYFENLTSIVADPKHIYQHKWQVGDAVLWDNRRVLHAGTPFDVNRYSRTMHRTTWREDKPIC